MERFENTILFGKYQLCRILGRGRSGTVYLAKHKDLEEYRAIKQVAKACVDAGQFRKEALILKCIRHPGIPVVYDLEEDEDFCYLIEEFLEGDSLYALVSDMGHFSKAMTVRYGIQICHLVNILMYAMVRIQNHSQNSQWISTLSGYIIIFFINDLIKFCCSTRSPFWNTEDAVFNISMALSIFNSGSCSLMPFDFASKRFFSSVSFSIRA